MKIATNISEKLKRWTGNKPASSGLSDVKETGEIRMGLDRKWTDMKNIAQEDIVSLIESEKSYGESNSRPSIVITMCSKQG